MSQETDQMVPLTFSLPQSLKDRIEELARSQDRPVASFLRVELAKIVEEKETVVTGGASK